MVVSRSDERYLVLAGHDIAVAADVRITGLGNTDDVVINGHAYALNRQSGEVIWKTVIDNQAFNLNQPDSVPILLFASRTVLTTPRGFDPASREFHILVLDKRNGRELYKSTEPSSVNAFQIDPDPKDKTIDINFYVWKLRLKFTDDPLEKPKN